MNIYYEIFKSIYFDKISLLLLRNLKMTIHALFKVLGGMAAASAKASAEGKTTSPVELILFFLVMIVFCAAMLYHVRQEVGRSTFSG